MKNSQRIRDPIHGLIEFKSEIDKLAWKVIETPDFQRLRRIRQLGFSEFTFPSATHSRFAHSIGVFHNARRLMEVVHETVGKQHFDRDRANDVLIAALVHDIGHGPFSHAFEKSREVIAEKNNSGPIEKHEKLSAKIISDESREIGRLLSSDNLGTGTGMSERVSRIIEAENPPDIYAAVLSSSFDADRLDYLVRDRYMTGTGTGAIDVDWLIDNLAARKIPIDQDDDVEPSYTHTFVFKWKGRQAAEDFLLARYRLYTEVYLHKTTRGFEVLLSALLCMVGDKSIDPKRFDLTDDHPVVHFLRHSQDIASYCRLDEFVLWEMFHKISRCGHSQASALAMRILNREHLFVLDLFSKFFDDPTGLLNAQSQIDQFAEKDLGVSIFKDAPKVNLYSSLGGDVDQTHKVVRVLGGDSNPKEITNFEGTIINAKLTIKRSMIRYYFLNQDDREAAIKSLGE